MAGQFPTSTTPLVGDLILVGPSANNAPTLASVEPGLYFVLNPAAPYQVAPAVSANPTRPVGTVPQAYVLAVYRSA
jgi:hypothetical protein